MLQSLTQALHGPVTTRQHFPGIMSIPLLDNTLFMEYESLSSIVTVVGMGMALIIQLRIGVLAYSKVCHSKSKIRAKLVVLFFIAFVCALLYTSCRVTTYTIDIWYGSHPAIPIIGSVSLFLYGLFLGTLLLNLVIRLYVTFRKSCLEMTRNIIILFVIIFVTLFVLLILVCVARTWLHHGLYLLASLLFFILYIAGCALAVRLFVINLSAVAKMQSCANSPSPPSALSVDSVECDKISLNNKQLCYLYLSAKYVLLFFVAILLTCLAFICVFIISFECAGLFVSIDLSVNLLCLYLQFAFATEHYRKCCGCLDSCCRMMVVKQAKRRTQRESQNMEMEVARALGVEEIK